MLHLNHRATLLLYAFRPGGVDLKAAIPITTRTSLFGGEGSFLLMRVAQAALCPKTTRSAMI